MIGDLAAGGRDARPSRPGTAARISTGAEIPAGADAVLQVEDAEVADGSGDRARVGSPPGCTSAAAARTCTPATCSPAPATC